MPAREMLLRILPAPELEALVERLLAGLRGQAAGGDSGRRCAICELPIALGETIHGAGDGAGQSFAHDACHWRREAERWEAAYLSVAGDRILRRSESTSRPPPLCARCRQPITGAQLLDDDGTQCAACREAQGQPVPPQDAAVMERIGRWVGNGGTALDGLLRADAEVERLRSHLRVAELRCAEAAGEVVTALGIQPPSEDAVANWPQVIRAIEDVVVERDLLRAVRDAVLIYINKALEHLSAAPAPPPAAEQPGPAGPTAGGTAEAGAVDLVAHLRRQSQWSERTFGPGPRPAGIIDHIRRELSEIEAAPGDLSEWIDVAILALDGAWRAGHSPEAIAAALVAKQARNESRCWPDWRTADTGKAIEHVRESEAGDAHLDQHPAAAGSPPSTPTAEPAGGGWKSPGWWCCAAGYPHHDEHCRHRWSREA